MLTDAPYKASDLMATVDDLERIRALGYEPFIYGKEERGREVRFKKARSGQSKEDKAEFMLLSRNLDNEKAINVLVLDNSQKKRKASDV